MPGWVKWVRAHMVLVLVHVGSLVPLAMLLRDYATHSLTANPIQDVQLRTGSYALELLVLSLACTPVSRILHRPWIQRLRRPLGLYAFLYATLHLVNYVALEYGFDFTLIGEDLTEKTYIMVGVAAFLALLLLAVTSTRGWMKRLGRNWRRLHWLVYAAGLLSVTHFALQVKSDLSRPVLFGVILAILLIIRLRPVRQSVNYIFTLVRKWNHRGDVVSTGG